MGLRNGPSNIKSADFLFHFGNPFEYREVQTQLIQSLTAQQKVNIENISTLKFAVSQRNQQWSTKNVKTKLIKSV